MAAGSTAMASRRSGRGRDRDLADLRLRASSRSRCFYFLFFNLMNSATPRARLGYPRLSSLSLPLMGKLLFVTFLVARPGDPIWSWIKGGTRRNSR